MSLQLRAASRQFGSHPVFSGLDMDVPAGMRLFIAGANGSGKTTMLRCASGTLALTSGQALISGHHAGSLPARWLTGTCLTTGPALYGQLSGRDNLLLAARLRLPRDGAAAAVRDIERELDLGDFAQIPVQRCSAGMRARIGIARALLGEPALLLLDEPSHTLDDSARTLLWAALDRRPRASCVIASHHTDDRARCHDVLTMPVRR